MLPPTSAESKLKCTLIRLPAVRLSLEIRSVVIPASAIANNEFTIRDKRAWVTRRVTLQRKIRDCSQSTLKNTDNNVAHIQIRRRL